MDSKPLFQLWRRAGCAAQRGSGTGSIDPMLSSGVITVVQEHRFELLCDDGTRRHFTLAHDAPLGWNELLGLWREGAHVAVRHDAAASGSTTAAVHRVARLQPGEPAEALTRSPS
jgi:hypothetical protein